MTEIETQIAQIWQQVLGFTVGSESNFFELGGNSLLLLQVQHKLQTQFGKQLTVADMFKYATVKAMAGYLSNQTVKNAKPCVRACAIAHLLDQSPPMLTIVDKIEPVPFLP